MKNEHYAGDQNEKIQPIGKRNGETMKQQMMKLNLKPNYYSYEGEQEIQRIVMTNSINLKIQRMTFENQNCLSPTIMRK